MSCNVFWELSEFDDRQRSEAPGSSCADSTSVITALQRHLCPQGCGGSGNIDMGSGLKHKVSLRVLITLEV